MNNRIFRNTIFILMVILWSTEVFAETVFRKYCTVWSATFTDQGVGEDYSVGDSIWGDRYWTAKYSHYKIKNKSTDIVVNEGILDLDGCTPVVELAVGPEYRFQQITWLERPGGRVVYISPENAEPFAGYGVSLNTDVEILGFPSQATILLRPDWNTPLSRVAVVAGKALQYYSTREFPPNRTIYIAPKNYTDLQGSFTTGTFDNCIRIDTYDSLHGGMDHSYYKFIIAHELGHAQASMYGSDGPLDTRADFSVESSVAKCNCSQTNYSNLCFQSVEKNSIAQSEGWGFFYAAALFNNREPTGRMGYPSPIWVVPSGGTPFTAYVDRYPPVAIDTQPMYKWMVTLCNDPGYGVMQDWFGFYWNVWTNGVYTYTVDEITDVYHYSSSTRWDDLASSATSLFGSGTPKTAQFIDKGSLAGVDGQ